MGSPRLPKHSAIDAHVVLSAREHGARAIVSSDTADLQALDPTVAALHHI